MAAFKVKNKIKKKEDFDNRITLDAKHKIKLDTFNNQHMKINKLKNELKILERRYNKFKSNDKLNDKEIEDKLNLKDKIENTKYEINLFNSNDEINYLLDTGNLLFNYYNKINSNTKREHKKTISVMDYFKHKKTKNSDKNSRINIYNSYLQKTDDEKFKFVSEINLDLCDTCNIEKKLFLSEGKQICEKCGDETKIIIDSDKPSYKDPPREISYFAYKRINHFNEWLAQFQAKESTDIPKQVYDEILIELKKERIININKLTHKKLREILKKLKKNKYYEHIPHIINKLNGIPPPIMSREIEEELRRMFKEIQIPFHKHCPENRKNFLSYSYVLHKFVQLLELDQFTSCFVLLKSREKLHQQDQIWKNICGELKWEFIPSI